MFKAEGRPDTQAARRRRAPLGPRVRGVFLPQPKDGKDSKDGKAAPAKSDDKDAKDSKDRGQGQRQGFEGPRLPPQKAAIPFRSSPIRR